MCAKSSFKGQTYTPRSMIPVSSSRKLEGTAHWGERAGLQRAFARSETLNEKWIKKGWNVELDHPVDTFHERSRKTNELVESDKLPEGSVIHFVGKRETGEAVLVTREATPEEREKFGHKRMPVTSERRFRGPLPLDTENM